MRNCFQDYYTDAARRFQHDRNFPNEPKLVKLGEGVDVVAGQLQISGSLGVMAINGLITKVIFDRNPKNEFFVEESRALDWMFPYLTPCGVIMKINRNPLPELGEDITRKDHAFWKQYSKRFTGDFIDYDTPLSEIARWIESTYLRHNFDGFAGDPKFVRDDDAQKAFSKLRGAIGGLYAWRAGLLFGVPTPREYLFKSATEQQRMLREAEFAYKQAFAFCPYSIEAVSRYINVLTSLGRWDDALLVAQTCLKLDPYNTAVSRLVGDLQTYMKQHGTREQAGKNIAGMEDELRKNPTNFQVAFALIGTCLQLQQTDRAIVILDSVLNQPQATPEVVFGVAQVYAQIGNWPKLEVSLEKLVKVMPEDPEAWYNLAAFKTSAGKPVEALKALRTALDLSSRRLQGDPKAQDLLVEIRKDERFNALRQTPEFQKLVGP